MDVKNIKHIIHNKLDHRPWSLLKKINVDGQTIYTGWNQMNTMEFLRKIVIEIYDDNKLRNDLQMNVYNYLDNNDDNKYGRIYYCNDWCVSYTPLQLNNIIDIICIKIKELVNN